MFYTLIVKRDNDDLKGWMAQNVLQLNMKKTEVIVIGPEPLHSATQHSKDLQNPKTNFWQTWKYIWNIWTFEVDLILESPQICKNNTDAFQKSP